MLVPRSLPRLSWLAALAVLAACADGGEQDRPQSEVRFTATHHMFGFRTLRGFGSIPLATTIATSDRGVLNLFDDSTYTVTRATGTSSPDRYSLTNAGKLSIVVTGRGSEPSVVFSGGYSLAGGALPGATSDYVFTDRVATPNSQAIGIFYGTRIVTGQVELEGAWHLLSLHAVFGQSLPSPDAVARAARGAVSIAGGAPGTQRSISGTGFQSSASLVFGGAIQNVLDAQNNGNGSCNLTVSYQLPGQVADSRVMFAAATNNMVFSLDADESDGEAGVLFLVRKFDPPATPVDSVRVPGRFLVGGHTFFVNPTNPGADTFVGVVTLSPQGAFRLDAVGNNGQDFAYVGTYSLAQDGGMTLQISGTNETWFAAIDRSYNTFVFVDDFIELRANNLPELNLGIGVREKPPQ